MKKKYNKIFEIEMLPTNYSIIVNVGKSKKELLTYIKKRCNKEYYKIIEDSYKEISGITAGNVLYHPDHQHLILTCTFKNKWSDYDTILHELVHAVDHVSNICGFDDEMEFRAYLTEYLFREIRRKITK